MIKAIIFDMCGVFINDSGPISLKIESKYHIPADELLPILKKALKEVRVPGVQSRLLWQPVIDKVGITYEDFFNFWFEGETLNEGLLQFTKELRSRGKKIIILSNNFPERTNYYRKRFPDLFESIDEQYFSWETGNVKPSKEAYTQILDKQEFKPEEYLYFDDSDDNLATATSLGILSHKYIDLDDTKKFVNKYL